ncbi:hypothetical protein CES86_1291 [Brucella lupini]|uniref:Uncharacterized protein n=1 Tax=Brucella lupini TaxID=255457 RepID=A0A256GXT3_9HYPH|nr:hypothetical protein CES86_1291 [Brucella lupini]
MFCTTNSTSIAPACSNTRVAANRSPSFKGRDGFKNMMCIPPG